MSRINPPNRLNKSRYLVTLHLLILFFSLYFIQGKFFAFINTQHNLGFRCYVT